MTEEVVPGVLLRKALNVLPWGSKYRLSNAINSGATARLLRRLAVRMPQPVVLWIYDPSAARMIGSSGEELAVYDCVDDYTEQTTSPRKRELVASCDRQAVLESRLVFATSTTMYERQRRLNPSTHLVPNAGDYKHFAVAADRTVAAPEVSDLPRPVLGFAGNFSRVEGQLRSARGVGPGAAAIDLAPDRPGNAGDCAHAPATGPIAERSLAGREALRRSASVRRRVRRRADPLRFQRLYAKLFSAEALRVPRCGEARRRKRPSRVIRDGARSGSRRRREGLRKRRSKRQPRATVIESSCGAGSSHPRTAGKRAGRLLELVQRELIDQA